MLKEGVDCYLALCCILGSCDIFILLEFVYSYISLFYMWFLINVILTFCCFIFVKINNLLSFGPGCWSTAYGVSRFEFLQFWPPNQLFVKNRGCYECVVRITICAIIYCKPQWITTVRPRNRGKGGVLVSWGSQRVSRESWYYFRGQRKDV